MKEKEKRKLFNKEIKSKKITGHKFLTGKYRRVDDLETNLSKGVSEDLITYLYAGNAEVDKLKLFEIYELDDTKKYNNYKEWKKKTKKKYKNYSKEELEKLHSYLVTKIRKNKSIQVQFKEFVIIFLGIFLTKAVDYMIDFYTTEYGLLIINIIKAIMFASFLVVILFMTLRMLSMSVVSEDEKAMYYELEKIIERLVN